MELKHILRAADEGQIEYILEMSKRLQADEITEDEFLRAMDAKHLDLDLAYEAAVDYGLRLKSSSLYDAEFMYQQMKLDELQSFLTAAMLENARYRSGMGAGEIGEAEEEKLPKKLPEKPPERQQVEGGENEGAESKKLPNVNKVTVDSNKVKNYALDPNHPVGGNKAKVFESSLGYNQSNADQLMKQVQTKLPSSEAVLGVKDQFGQRFTVDIPITGPNGNTAIVRTGWILELGSEVPRMTTIYVK